MMTKENELPVYSLLLLFGLLVHWFLVARHKYCQWCIDLSRNMNVNICTLRTIHFLEWISPTWFYLLRCRSHGIGAVCRGYSRAPSFFRCPDWSGTCRSRSPSPLLPLPSPRRGRWRGICHVAPAPRRTCIASHWEDCVAPKKSLFLINWWFFRAKFLFYWNKCYPCSKDRPESYCCGFEQRWTGLFLFV